MIKSIYDFNKELKGCIKKAKDATDEIGSLSYGAYDVVFDDLEEQIQTIVSIFADYIVTSMSHPYKCKLKAVVGREFAELLSYTIKRLNDLDHNNFALEVCKARNRVLEAIDNEGKND